MRCRVGFVSLGCPKNLVDTENMMHLLGKSGALLTGDQSQADIVVVNTCGFLEAAKNESMSTIGEFIALKKKKKIKGVVVAGCMTERYLGVMNERYPEVDAFIQTREFSKIVDVVHAIESGDSETLRRRRDLIGEIETLKGHSELTDFVDRIPGPRSYAYVKIAEGCNRTCSFCIIPKLRGKLHSRSVEGIVDEVQRLVEQGVKEVILIAQDLTSYGRDRSDGANLLGLMRELEKIEGLQWVRLHYNYPRFFTDELIEFLSASKVFSGYLDIPFQHISDRILKQMRRPESSAEIKALVEKLKLKIPNLSLRSTFMVGFPGETDQDFEELMSFVKWAELDHLGTFKYCPEEGTPSAQFENQIPESVKESRFHQLMMLQKGIQKRKLKEKLETHRTVVIDAFSEKTKQGLVYVGRHAGQSPEIDGVTYILSDSELKAGQFVDVQLVKIMGDYDLFGMPKVEFDSLAQPRRNQR
jgi:ribosomal protein S12 methylthiotransferase